MIHGFHDLRNATQPVDRKMQSTVHHLEDRPEPPKLPGLGRDQWICLEERNNLLAKIASVEDREAHEVFSVIVMALVSVDLAAPEVLSKNLESSDAAFPLHHHESRLDLPPDPHDTIALDRTAETTFTVDEADDPLLDSWPFLLIARTRRIVTSHGPPYPEGLTRPVPRDARVFQHIASCTSRRHQREGQQVWRVTFVTLGRL
jgi:hypothetical protein